ncbi:MAG: hypothetical protein ABR545_01930 [Cyclonatronaceae bacterium]
MKILCLHAGNLPMVGLQDVVAVLLSGNRYFGKFSRNDPWLIASFVDVCRERGLPEVCGCSTELGSFSGLRADAVLFTGSDKTVPAVMDELFRLKAVNTKPKTRYLIRTAQLSVAIVRKKQSAWELFEAVTRYDGRGCRSVGVVVSPYSLDKYAGALRMAEACRKEKVSVPEPGAESDGNDHVPESVAGRSADTNNGPKKYLHAYAVAAGLPSLQLFDGRWMFIESDDTGLIREGVVLWIKGGEEELGKVQNRLSGRIQSVFTDGTEMEGVEGKAGEAEIAEGTELADLAGDAESADESVEAALAGDDDFESLNKAQRPEFDWSPDGLDTLQWLAGFTKPFFLPGSREAGCRKSHPGKSQS